MPEAVAITPADVYGIVAGIEAECGTVTGFGVDRRPGVCAAAGNRLNISIAPFRRGLSSHTVEKILSVGFKASPYVQNRDSIAICNDRFGGGHSGWPRSNDQITRFQLKMCLVAENKN